MRTEINVITDNIPSAALAGEWGLCLLIHFNGKKILVEFLKLLRREEKFPSIQALIAQMEKDKAKAEEIFRLQADSLVL